MVFFKLLPPPPWPAEFGLQLCVVLDWAPQSRALCPHRHLSGILCKDFRDLGYISVVIAASWCRWKQIRALGHGLSWSWWHRGKAWSSSLLFNFFSSHYVSFSCFHWTGSLLLEVQVQVLPSLAGAAWAHSSDRKLDSAFCLYMLHFSITKQQNFPLERKQTILKVWLKIFAWLGFLNSC